jgi:Type I phosphodiesterase / nucleotide pyrophosphatase
MRFLRMLTNALAGGLLGAAYLTVLILQLNPELPIVSSTTWHWGRTLAIFYGAHLIAFFYVALTLRELAASPVSAGWLSVRLLAWMAALASAAAAALMWINLQGFALALGEPAVRRMTIGAAAMTAAAAVVLLTAVARYSFGKRGSPAAGTVLVLAIIASIAAPLASRGPGQPRPLGGRRLDLPAANSAPAPGRVVLLLLDGASLEYLWPRAAEGRLPHFDRLLTRGATIDLATIRPTQPETVWTAAATGKYPPANGVRSRAIYRVHPSDTAVDILPDYTFSHLLVRLELVSSDPTTSAAWRARPIWHILGSFGLDTGVVRWPVTAPTRPVRGFLVSDRFHLISSPLLRLDDEAIAYPPAILPVTRGIFAEAAERPDVVPAGLDGGETVGGDGSEARWDPVYARAARELAASSGPLALTAVRYAGLDDVGHVYLRYAQPREFGDVSEAERQRYGEVLDRYYRYIDAEIGPIVEGLGPEDLLLVVSGFGMQPVTPGKRLVARAMREGHITGTHDRAPDGFLIAYGAHVTTGKLPERGSIVDVAPTVLYFLGLPVGRDMDGFARTDLFVRSFTADRPITFIATHDR